MNTKIKPTRKILSLALTFAFVLMLLPAFTALAADPVNVEVGHTGGVVAKSNVLNAMGAAGLQDDLNDPPFTVTFAPGVTTIANAAFAHLHMLKSVAIPDSVTAIGDYVFQSSGLLTDITVAGANPNFSSEDGVLFNKDKTTLIQYPVGNTRTTYTIPNSVIEISEAAFYFATSLTSVTIPNGLTTIGDHAFAYCLSLKSINIPNSVTTVAGSYFAQSAPIETLYIDMTTIPDAFSNMSELKNLTIGDNVTTIEGQAFTHAISLTSVTIPSSVTTLETAFHGCTSLANITVAGANPNYSSENGVLFNKDKTTLIKYPPGNTRTTYTIPNSVTYIGGASFWGCTALTSVVIGSGVTEIGGGAFMYCENLYDVYFLPFSIQTWSSGMFGGVAAGARAIVTPDEWGYSPLGSEGSSWNGLIVVYGAPEPVPPTGIPGITGYMWALIMFLLLSAVLWGTILRRRLVQGRNG